MILKPKNKHSDEKTLNDIVGYPEEKEEARKIIYILKNAKKMQEDGINLPKGLLLAGRPGVGKTLLAMAIVHESGLPCFSITTENTSVKEITRTFQKARRKSPSILFIDEMDKLCSYQGFLVSDEGEATIRTLLTQLDANTEKEPVLVIATLNDFQCLPYSLVRSGRFDCKIKIATPDLKARESIFDYYVKRVRNIGEIDCEKLAKETPGLTGADIFNIVNSAAIDALSSGQKLETENLEVHIPLVCSGGVAKQQSSQDRNIIACHEAGHAILSYSLLGDYPSVSLYQYNNVRGLTMSQEDTTATQNKLVPLKKTLDQITVLLGGKMAESLYLKENYGGLLSDISNARSLIRYLCSAGYFGYRYCTSDEDNPSPFGKGEPNLVNEKITEVLEEQSKRAEEILTDKSILFHALWNRLKEVNYLSSDEFKEIVKTNS